MDDDFTRTAFVRANWTGDPPAKDQAEKFFEQEIVVISTQSNEIRRRCSVMMSIDI